MNGTSTLTAFIGSVQTTSGSTTTTTYYGVQGKRIAANVNGTFSYFGYDALGSQVVVLNSSGILVGSQLYGPDGSSRYSNGTLPTSIGFTGQQHDSVSGLDYYVARYYDPVVGQFLSADVKQGNAQGVDPYAYVAGNPETLTDPTGQRAIGCQPGTEGCSPTGVPKGGGGGGSNPCTLSGGNPAYCGPEGGGSKPSPGTGGSSGGSGGCHGGGTKMGASGCNNSGGSNGGCGKPCGDRDRQLIVDHVKKQQTFWANVSTAIGDGSALLGDIISALLHLLAGDWTGFGFELASTLARAAAFIGDLGKIGIISMPPFLADILSGLKWVSTVIDVAGGLFNWFNPLSGTVNLFGKWAIDRVKLYGASRIAQLVASGLSATGTVFIPDMLGSAYWDGQIAQANAYSDQQAYNVCLQDYASEPGMC